MIFDLGIVGLGAMGSAVFDHASRRGLSVLGIEQYAPAHAFGSSHGKARMIRKAYFEDPAYVPLIVRAYELWTDLERRSGESILRKTGVLVVGSETGATVRGVRASAERHDLPIRVFDSLELRRAFPMMRPLPDELGVFEADGGFLRPEAAIGAQLASGIAAGGRARFDVRAIDYALDPSKHLELRLGNGERVRVRKLALCGGSWLASRAEALGIEIAVTRKVQIWFAPDRRTDVSPARCPAFLLERAEVPGMLYGFPDVGDGVKASFHKGGAVTTLDAMDRTISDADVSPVRAALQTLIPGAGATVLGASVCAYDMTPDEHFAIGAHAANDDVIIVGGFSGHGFKFAPVVGEIVADLVADGGTRFDIDFLSPRRFARDATKPGARP